MGRRVPPSQGHLVNDTQSRDGTGLLSIGEVADLFGVNVSTIRRWDDAGKLHAIRTPGGQRRFDRAEVERVLRGDVA